MKTIIARFEDMKKDPMAILEDGVSANKVEDALKSIGIALRDTAGEFRPLQDVMDELGMKWDSLTRNQQAYIATMAAGSRQQSRFLAMMNNYGRTLDLISESQNSAGAAAQQYATYQDSIAAAQARLTASWEKLYSKIVDNDIIKFVINGLSELLELLSHIPPSITAIGATIGALQLQKFFSDKGGFRKILYNIITPDNAEKTGIGIAKKFIDGFANKSMDQLKQESPNIINMFKSLAKNSVSSMGKMASGLAGVTKAIGVFISTNAAVLGVAAAVAVVIGGITYALTKQKREYEQNIKTIKEYNDSANELSTRSTQGEELFKRYEELSQKISLTEEEQNELNTTIQQISEIYPEAIEYVDEYGRHQFANAEQIKENIELEKQLAQAQKNNALNKRTELLNGDRSNWKIEDFQNIGFYDKNVQEYFKAQEDINYYNRIKSSPNFSDGGRYKFFGGEVADLNKHADVTKRYVDLFGEKDINASKEVKERIEEINDLIDDYNLKTNKLSSTSSWEAVQRKLEEINNLYVNLNDNLEMATDAQELALRKMQKSTNVELSLNNLQYSDNTNIAASQRMITAQIQAMFEKMDVDVWDFLLERQGGVEGLTEGLQTIIDSVSPENKVDLFNLFKDFNAGNIPFESFIEQFITIAGKGGSSAAIEFARSFGEQLKQQLEGEKERFREFFGNIGVTAETRNKASDKLQIGEGQLYQDYAKNYLTDENGDIMANASEGLLKIPAKDLKQIELDYKEAIESGNVSAIIEVRDKWIETWSGIDAEVANLIAGGKMQEALQLMLKQAKGEFIKTDKLLSSFEKKDYSSIDISEGSNYYSLFNDDEGNNTFWDHATIENGKIVLDLIAQQKIAEKDLADNATNYTEEIENAKKILEEGNLTDEEKKSLEESIKYWEQAQQYAIELGDIIEEKIHNPFIDSQRSVEELVAYAKENLQDIYNVQSRESTADSIGNYEVGTYIDNETGEARVSSLERARELETQIAATIAVVESTYRKINEEYQKLVSKGEDLTDEEKDRKRELEGQLNILGQQNKVLNQQKNNLAQNGWGVTISLAEKYQSKLKTIDSIQKSISKKGFVNPNEMNQIYQIMPEFAKEFQKTSDNMYTIKEQSLENMKKTVQDEYEFEVAVQRQLAVMEYDTAKAEYESLLQSAEAKGVVLKEDYKNEVETMDAEVNANRSKDEAVTNAAKQAAEASGDIGAKSANNLVTLIRQALEQIGKDIKDFIDSNGEIQWGNLFDAIKNSLKAEDFTAIIGTEFNKENFQKAIDEFGQNEMYQALVDNAKKRMEAALAKIRAIDTMDLNMINDLEGKLGEAASAGADALSSLADALDELTNTLEELGSLLDDLPNKFKGIKVDYNPFTELFEEWEHEWDYYFNIRNREAELQRFFDISTNLANKEWMDPKQRMEYDEASAQILINQMANRDMYIQALRTDLAKQAADITENYGQYYRINPDDMQIFQNNQALDEINQQFNEAKKVIYDYDAAISKAQNDLALLNAKLQVSEAKDSIYEDAKNSLDDLISYIEENEDVTISNLDNLKGIRDNLEKAWKDGTTEGLEDAIAEAEKYLQTLDWEKLGAEQTLDGMEKWLSGMLDAVSKYQEMRDSLFEKINEQFDSIDQLYEIRQKYVDASINMENALYSAIVENYQNEINAKKKQYDELKKLDDDYLSAIKDNINKEREAREEAKNQKAYQQNLQRAQLLQMDTSGAYRNQLSSIKVTIEQQQEELYDNMIDKQVQAIEEEMARKHELYDKEVAALEERLNYYQENAFLLWEQVNTIVKGGTNNMMAILEGTAEYTKMSELQRQEQWKAWDLETQMAYKGAVEGQIATWDTLIDMAGDAFGQKYPEVTDAIDKYADEFDETKRILEAYNKVQEEYKKALADGKNDQDAYNTALKNAATSLSTSIEDLTNTLELKVGEFNGHIDNLFFTGSSTFLSILGNAQDDWMKSTSTFTGHVDDYNTTMSTLISDQKMHETELKNLNTRIIQEGNKNIGSLSEYRQKLIDEATERYNDYIKERESYETELNALIEQIQNDISSAIKDAADAIRDAINSLNASGGNGGDGSDGNGGNGGRQPGTGPGNGPGNGPGTGPGEGTGTLKGWKAWFAYSDGATFSHTGVVSPEGNATYDQVYQNWQEFLKGLRVTDSGITSWGLQYFAKGGLANFTGPAWLDGTKSAPERILSPKQTQLFESMVSSLERASNNSNINSALGASYNIGDINTSIQVAKLDNQTDINKLAKQVEDKIVNTIRNRVVVSI